MPIAKEILDMFEFSRKDLTFSIDNLSDEWPLSQQRSVPIEPLTLSMHRYILIESHRKPSVALWGTPLKGGNPLSYATEIIIKIKQFYSGRMA